MTELFVLAPVAVTLTDLGFVFFLALFLFMAYWKNIPMFHLFAAGVAFYGAWILSDDAFLLIVLVGLALFEMLQAYLKVKN